MSVIRDRGASLTKVIKCELDVKAVIIFWIFSIFCVSFGRLPCRLIDWQSSFTALLQNISGTEIEQNIRGSHAI